MQPNSQVNEATSAYGWWRVAVISWCVLLLAVCTRGAIQQRTHSLYETFLTAGAHWANGTSLYYWWDTNPGVEPFRYSPLIAALLVPFSLSPPALGNVLWRLLNATVFLGGIAAWLRSPLPWRLEPKQQAWLILLVLPLSLSSLNNGQTNPMVIGLLLGAAAAATTARWNLAAVTVALATALKLYPLAFGLLLAAVYPRKFISRFVLALAVCAALPFLFRQSAYVIQQYQQWAHLLGDDDRKYWPLNSAYRDLWLLIRVVGLPVSPQFYTVIQVLTGAACAVVCVAGRLRGWEPKRVVTAALMLGTCWMLLCGPATESSTYVILGPALAWGLVTALTRPWPRFLGGLTIVSAVLLWIGVLAGLSPWVRDIHGLGEQPLATLLLFIAYFAVYTQELWRKHSGVEDFQRVEARAA